MKLLQMKKVISIYVELMKQDAALWPVLFLLPQLFYPRGL